MRDPRPLRRLLSFCTRARAVGTRPGGIRILGSRWVVRQLVLHHLAQLLEEVPDEDDFQAFLFLTTNDRQQALAVRVTDEGATAWWGPSR